MEVLPEDPEAYQYISDSVGVNEAVSIDPDYGNREGYDPNFLGTAAQAVPLPRMTPAMTARAAVNLHAGAGTNPLELRYRHFSVVVNRARRLAFFTAVNIDGRLAVAPSARTINGSPTRGFRSNLRSTATCSRRPNWTVATSCVRWTRRGVTTPPPSGWRTTTHSISPIVSRLTRFNEGRSLWAGLEDFLLSGAPTTRASE